MNKEFKRCCRQIAKMMEKYSSLILRDIEKEIKYRPELFIEQLIKQCSFHNIYSK